ncbi:MAG: YIP1 family protein [Deltaproteobacteria bacterium]|nr:YIP1 family protein [Deltaproteobacteria bacterium]MBW2136489.1 YIP1 family protein [Deltaproteobacteria bacterium]
MVLIVCPNCNFSKEVQREKIPPGVRYAICPRCKRRFELTVTRTLDKGGGSEGPGIPEGTLPPWEKRLELGLWQGIYRTFKEVLLSPETIFHDMTCRRGIKEPLAFGVLFGSVGSMFSFFWQFLTGWGRIISLAQGALGQIGLSLVFVSVMIFIPIFVLITMFLGSAVLHLVLVMSRAGNKGFEGTFRVVAYSQVAQIMGFFPFVGGFIGGLWQLIIQIIGLREIHDTSYLRIFMALFLGVVLILLLILAMVIPFFLLR